jgi:hypothetical protein
MGRGWSRNKEVETPPFFRNLQASRSDSHPVGGYASTRLPRHIIPVNDLAPLSRHHLEANSYFSFIFYIEI